MVKEETPKKKRSNPIAKALNQHRHQVVRDKRKDKLEQIIDREAKEDD